jgi:hypothetical protein
MVFLGQHPGRIMSSASRRDGSECEVNSTSETCMRSQLLTARSEDGSVVMRDERAESTLTRAQGTIRNDSEFASVQWHPVMEHIFATADERGRCLLRDARMAFGPVSARRGEGIVLTVRFSGLACIYIDACCESSMLQSCQKRGFVTVQTPI